MSIVNRSLRKTRSVTALAAGCCLAFFTFGFADDPPKPPTAAQKPADESQGSDLLREIRRKSQPLLEGLAKKQGYRLEEGENIRRVGPPFAPLRMEYYRTSGPSQAEAIPSGPSGMVFHWEDNRLRGGGMTFGGGEDDGYSLTGLSDAIFDLKDQSIEGPKKVLLRRISGDWIVRRDKNFDAATALKELEAILRREWKLDVSLRFRDVQREVYVARGDYVYAPIDPAAKKEKIILTDETFEVDAIDVYGKVRYVNSGSGGGTGEVSEFFDWVARWIKTPIVNETSAPPKNLLSWRLHGDGSPDDHDPELVLKHVAEQTGFGFKKESRSITILSVETSSK